MQRRHTWAVLFVVLLAITAWRHGWWLPSNQPGTTTPATARPQQRPAPGDTGAHDNSATAAPGSDAPVAGDVDAAFRDHSTNVIVTASGTVARVLADDTQGLRHQRFVLRMSSGLTVLVAHDIDAAPRIPDLRAGVPLLAHGEYVWNAEGGIVHWTHHDSSGRHAPGWIEYQGQRYQ